MNHVENSENEIVALKDLRKSYGDFEAVRGISLVIRKGEIFGFLGPNGAGKTTTINMILGLLKPSSGELRVYGNPPKKHQSEIKKQIGYIPQDLMIWEDLTVKENLLFLADMYGCDKGTVNKRITWLLDEVGLTNKQNELARNLSGGLKRRLNFIMGLVHDPDLIIMDEPTPGLDPQARAKIWDFIHALAKEHNKTIILTTHYMEEADRLSDRIGIIDQGKLLVVDTPENIKRKYSNTGIIELQITPASHLGIFIEAVKKHNNIQVKEVSGSKLTIELEEPTRGLQKILQASQNLEGVKVTDVRLRQATLEDVFIGLTGRKLRD